MRATRSTTSAGNGWARLWVTVRSIFPAADIIERVNVSTIVGTMPPSPNTNMTPRATARVVSPERSPRPRR